MRARDLQMGPLKPVLSSTGSLSFTPTIRENDLQYTNILISNMFREVRSPEVLKNNLQLINKWEKNL